MGFQVLIATASLGTPRHTWQLNAFKHIQSLAEVLSTDQAMAADLNATAFKENQCCNI